jgi:hypothetical protein
MLRPLRIVKPEKTEESGKALETVKKVQLAKGTSPPLVSVALRYQGRGLSLAELVAAGEDGWQRAQRHFGEATEQFERWGFFWVQESILRWSS